MPRILIQLNLNKVLGTELLVKNGRETRQYITTLVIRFKYMVNTLRLRDLPVIEKRRRVAAVH
jgi:hypothetical protein